MALVILQTEQTYQSIAGGETYTFNVFLDQAGNCAVREIRTPLGLISDTNTSIPAAVLDDINTAKAQLETLVAQTSAVNGILTYVDENSKSFAFVTAFATDSYAVIPTLPDFISYRVTGKTTTGFTLELSTNFTGDIRFDVFV